MSRRSILCAAFVLACASAAGQNIRGRYVSRVDDDGTIYHLLPVTLFEHRTNGDLTFDLTYKEGPRRHAVLNFTYYASAPLPADSVSFDAGQVSLSGPVERFYIEAEKKNWKHRYSLQTDSESVHAFFDEEALPRVVVYSGGAAYPYEVKKSAWRAYAPIGRKIFEMIRLNEAR